MTFQWHFQNFPWTSILFNSMSGLFLSAFPDVEFVDAAYTEVVVEEPEDVFGRKPAVIKENLVLFSGDK